MGASPQTRDIEAFNMVAIELNFGRAAERLAIDQSALSRRIRQLEARLGYQLIRRTTRKVSLTPAGEVFYERTRLIASELEAAVRAGRIAAEGKRGMLRIGYMSFAAIELMPKIVHEFAKRYPDIELDLRYIRTQGQKIELSRNNIDLGFMLGPYQHPQLESRILLQEPLVAILPVNHGLSTRRSITLAEIAENPIVLGNMAQWEFFRLLIDDIFTKGGHSLDIQYEASNAMGILGLVSNGLGVSVYAESIARLKPQSIAIKPITDCDTQISTLLCWNRAYQSAAMTNFVAVAEEFVCA